VLELSKELKERVYGDRPSTFCDLFYGGRDRLFHWPRLETIPLLAGAMGFAGPYERDLFYLLQQKDR
jgi:hypothetical protein